MASIVSTLGVSAETSIPTSSIASTTAGLTVSAGADPADVLVAIADLLGDVIVYCRSEALKYGLPLEEVLDVIMDSNESKLGADGKPIYDGNGKFLKGPNYWKPEPRIKALLEAKGIGVGGEHENALDVVFGHGALLL